MNFEIATEVTLTFYSYLLQTKTIILPYLIQLYTMIVPLIIQLYKRFNYSLNIVAPLTLGYILTRRNHYIIRLITMGMFLYISIKFEIFRIACKYVFICIFVKSL